MSFCSHCLKGVRHEGTPEGKYEEIGGVRTYVATPEGDYPKDKALIFLTDVFGLDLPNNPLLADDYARNGFKVYAPDVFEGDPVPARFDPGANDFDFAPWIPQHRPERTLSIVRAVLDALKAQGVTHFAAIGYCYGCRLVFDLAFANEIDVAVGNHMTFIEAVDLEKYVKTSKAPLLINSCEVDPRFPMELSLYADKVFKDFEPGYRRDYYPGAEHGFAVRGDMSIPSVKAAKEGAFKGAVEWFQKYSF